MRLSAFVLLAFAISVLAAGFPGSSESHDVLAATPSHITVATGKKCFPTMCISATINGTMTTYELSQAGTTKAGYMAIGWGAQMANTSMVILWKNADGSVTLSQREATAYNQPTVLAKPAFVATLDKALTAVASTKPTFAFTVPTQGTGTTQSLIYAFGATNPDDATPDAHISIHLDANAFQLTLMPIASSPAVPINPAAPPKSPSPTSTGKTPPSTLTSGGLTGGKTCSSAMCISAIVNSTMTTYELTSVGSTVPGYMSIGWGTSMANAPMVIMWQNADGTITLSQRQAPGSVMPKLVTNPARVATLNSNLTMFHRRDSAPSFSFSMPNAGNIATQDLIWAVSPENPGSSDPSVPITKHTAAGVISLDVSQPLSGDGSVPTAAPADIPLTSYETLILAHAVALTLAFMLFLPSGTLIARYLRITNIKWFNAHMFIQFYLAGPVIILGFIFAIVAVQNNHEVHFSDTHMMVGLVVVVLFFVQCALGAFIHWVKNPYRLGRPPQNYLHAVLGLATIGLAWFNIYTGFQSEWPTATGLDPVSSAVRTAFVAVIVLLALLYTAGLGFLRTQYRQEARQRSPKGSHMSKMRQLS